MRIIIQRVKSASVDVIADSGEVRRVGEITAGYCVLVGVTHDDGEAEVAKVSRKIAELKLLRGPDNADEPSERVSLEEARDTASVLLVSQFTLYADVRKGRKPGWSRAAGGEQAKPIFEALVAAVGDRGIHVETGEFGAMMDVQLINDGPFTIFYDTDQ